MSKEARPPSPTGKFIPSTPPSATRRRKVLCLRFARPVFVMTLGSRRELVADTELTVDVPGGLGVGTPIPPMWYLSEEQVITVGTQRFHVANAIVESFDVGE